MQIETLSSPAAATDPQVLYATFVALRRERRLRHRDAAQALGVSECEAVASAVGQRGALSCVRLARPWPELFEQIPRLGRVLALTRNDSAVHEKTGCYENMSHEGQMGLALGRDIDLRIFYSRWAHGYAVTEQTAHGVQRSLQFFDAHGVAIHKVFLRDDSNAAALSELAARHASADQRPGERVQACAAPAAPVPDDTVDLAAFHAAWQALADTHEFVPLLRRFKLAREQALRLAPPGHAYRVPKVAVRRLLQQAASRGVSIMCFVGNPGMIQIHTGPVRRVEVTGPWLNVLDPGFNLHLREDAIAAAWVVKKRTRDGDVTSLELFDVTGATMAMFFGERKPGRPEQDAWRALVEGLSRLDG